MTETDNAAHRAGRLVLAVADDDTMQIVTIVREAADTPSGVLGLIVQLATVAIESAAAVVGDDWRSAMSTALLALELGDAPL